MPPPYRGMPVSPQAYRPATALTEIADVLADPVTPADFPQTIIRFRNDRAAAEIGLETLTDTEWAAHLGRFQPPQSIRLASRYVVPLQSSQTPA